MITQDLLKHICEPILIIGADGFIGRHLLDYFTQQGMNVQGLGRTHSDHPLIHVLPSLPEQLQFINTKTWGTIFDLASEDHHLLSVANLSTENSLDRVTRLVSTLPAQTKYLFAGTSCEYGRACYPGKEEQRPRPNSPYALLKAQIQQALSYFGEHENKACIHLRLFSIYGPGQFVDNLIPQMILHARKNSFPPLANPKHSHDFVYIDDAIEALVCVAAKMRPEHYGQVYNVASGRMTTMQELTEIVEKLFSVSAKPVFYKYKSHPWDQDYWLGDTSLMKTAFQWEAKTNLENGLRLTHQQEGSTPFRSKRHAPLKLTAIIACYNDETAIPEMYFRLNQMIKSQKLTGEIIFVNDGSKDNSKIVLKKLCQSDAQVIAIHHTRNFGSQAAFISGLRYATGDVVVFMDGDLQDPPELIPEMLHAYHQGHKIVGARRVRRQMPAWAEFFYKGFYKIWAKLCEFPIDQDVGDFALIDRAIYNQLLHFDENQFFLRGLRSYISPASYFVDYSRPQRKYGKSTNSWIKNWEWAKFAILQFSPVLFKRYFDLSLMLFAALTPLVFLLFFTQHFNFFQAFVVILLLLTNLGVGLITQSIPTLLAESKRRPRFLIESIDRYLSKSEPQWKVTSAPARSAIQAMER